MIKNNNQLSLGIEKLCGKLVKVLRGIKTWMISLVMIGEQEKKDVIEKAHLK